MQHDDNVSPTAFVLLAPEPASVAKARRFVADQLEAWGLEPFDLVLAASELVTNVIQHAPSPVGVGVGVLRRTGEVGVHVVDGRPDLIPSLPVGPEVPSLDGVRVRGRGLGLVARLGGVLAIHAIGTDRKAVCARFALRPDSWFDPQSARPSGPTARQGEIT